MTSSAPARRVRLDLGYRGTNFHGFAANPSVATVEGALTHALEKILRHEVQLVVAGRTDRGVHATGQVVSFDTVAAHFEPGKSRSALNKLLAPDIAVSKVSIVDDGFHARFSATGRRYRYRLLAREIPDPLRADLVWWVPPPVSSSLLDEVATKIVGSHDFSGFCRRPKRRPKASLVRDVRDAKWFDVGDELQFVISANAFCHQMVRSIVGTSVEVARGRLDIDVVDQLLLSGDRNLAPELAAPGGLVLEAVSYDGEHPVTENRARRG